MMGVCGCSRHHAGIGGNLDSPSGEPGAVRPTGVSRKGKAPKDGPPCLVSEVVAEIALQGSAHSADLLFVIDDSGSMKEEQAALARQFPRMIERLVEGASEVPIDQLHLGVVSTDLGLVGIEDIFGCPGVGDDGLLQHAPHGGSGECKASYPPFLSYDSGADPALVASDLACIARLGTDGCGFEQPLESALKALWPATDSRVTFLDENGLGGPGHGDAENAGFLHPRSAEGESVLAVVIVSDEEDCSSKNTRHFTPETSLDPGNPEDAELLKQGLNVRCAFNPRNLYEPSRYVDAFKALRPGDEQLVLFGALVGVPRETVSPPVSPGADFENPTAPQDFYQRILDDPRMQPVVDNQGTDDPADDTMRTSCNTVNGLAYPPRRIVQVAQGFGENGVVGSICDADFTPFFDALLGRLEQRIGGAVCLPRPIARASDGRIACGVVWELPAPNEANAATPTQCNAQGFSFLLPPRPGEPATNARGGQNCRVAQLAALPGDDGSLATVPTDNDGAVFDQGWFYDDFTASTLASCNTVPQQRIAFSGAIKVPHDVTVKLRCLDQELPGAIAPTGADPSGDVPVQADAVCSAGAHAADASHVGATCQSLVIGPAGFDPREVFLSAGTTECGGGVCAMDHLDGDPQPGCTPDDTKRCASSVDIARHVYCTCRCDAPEGYAQCACPDGFRCEHLLDQGGDDLNGGYCLRAN